MSNQIGDVLKEREVHIAREPSGVAASSQTINTYKTTSKTVYKISDFLSWQRGKSLVLSPNFQRRSVWPQAAKSLLIDTVVRGIPMPIIFIRERTDLQTLEPIREVVDGQQRLRTLIAFIEPKLLKDYDESRDLFVVKKLHNKDIAGKTFRQLDASIRQQVLNYDFSVHVLPADTEDRDVLQIFARMNSTGVKLNAQELRNAEFYGAFKKLCYTLAYEQLERWRKWRIFSETDIARMIEVEATGELIRLMLHGVQSKSQPALNKLYLKYEEGFPHGVEATRRFRTVMDKIDESLGSELNTLAFSRKVLFETLFTFYYDLLFGLDGPLRKAKANPLPTRATKAVKDTSDLIQHGELDDDVAKVLRGGTGNKESRTLRLAFLQVYFTRGKA